MQMQERVTEKGWGAETDGGEEEKKGDEQREMK